MAISGHTAPLALHQQLLLVALKDREGSINWRANQLSLVLAGGMVAELLLRNRIRIEHDKHHKVHVIDMTSLEDEVLDQALGRIRESKRPRSLQDWVFRLASLKKLIHRVASPLAYRGIIRRERKKVLWIFPVTHYPEVNPEPEQQMIATLREAIFTDTDQVDVRTAVLLALLYHSEWLNIYFPKKEWKTHKQRIESIITGDLVSEATREAIEAAQAAATIAAIMPAITAGATTAATS